MRVIQVQHYGPPDVLLLKQQTAPQALAGQVLIEIGATVASFGDTLARSGGYPHPLPFVPGFAVGGTVIGVGPDVDRSWMGKSVVAQTYRNVGGYAEQALADAAGVIEVPAGLSIQQATAIFLKGQTAVGLLKAMDVRPGQSVLITAAAGGVGSMMVQLARTFGAGKVIGAAGGAEKVAYLERIGVDAAVDYQQDDWVAQVKQATGGRGADVVLDAIGGRLGEQACQALANAGGRLGVYGFTSGSWTSIDTRDVALRGISLVGPLGIALSWGPEAARANTEFALAQAAEGHLTAELQIYPLERAADAHRAIEARETIGSVLLVP